MLNPGQTTVDVADEPLFARCKEVQWFCPGYGKKVYFPLMGGFHIEKMLLTMYARLVEKTGLVECLNKSKITQVGSGTALISISNNVSRAKMMLQVVTVALHRAKKHAYDNRSAENSTLDMQSWESIQTTNSDMFQYWNLIYDVGLTYLGLERASRSGNFKLYCAVLETMMPLAFSLDRINYERWLAVHIHDLRQLKGSNPDLHKEFSDGKFVVSVSKRPFSSLAIDQGHEQTNRTTKNLGGALGSELNELWGLARPEVIRVTREYEDVAGITVSMNEEERRYDDHLSPQQTFLRNTQYAYEAVIQNINPFSETQKSLVFLNNGELMNSCHTISNNVRALYKTGQELYHKFRKERLIEHTVPFTDPIRKQMILLPGDQDKLPPIVIGLTSRQETAFIQELKEVVTVRPTAAAEAFNYEPFNVPGALTKHGTSYFASKAQVLNRFQKQAQSSGNPFRIGGALIVDLSYVTILIGSSGNFRTFRCFCEAIWNYLTHIGSNNTRIDVVCDNYHSKNLLKQKTRANRGTGSDITFTLDTSFPKDFSKDFMKSTNNKKKLYDYLIAFLYEQSLSTTVLFVFTNKDQVISNGENGMQESSHLEADYRLVLHVIDAIREGHKRVVVRSNDTDVLVILMSYYQFFTSLTEEHLDLSLMCGKKSSGLHFIDIGAAVETMPPRHAKGLPLLFSMSGCDFVESFFEVGKLQWLNAYLNDSEIGNTFASLIEDPSSLISVFEDLSSFVLKVYKVRDNTSGCVIGRIEILKHRTISTLRQLPPSKPSLFQHIRRALYVAAFVWGNAHEPTPAPVNPFNWGWVEADGLCVPLWTNVIYDTANKSMDPFHKLRSTCSCGKRAKIKDICKACSCRKNQLKCWAKCGCFGKCC